MPDQSNRFDQHPKQRLSLWFLRCLFICLSNGIFAQTSYVNFEGKQTSPVRLSQDGTRLFAVNTPDARLSVFDVTKPSNPLLIAEIPVGVEPVSVNPRTPDEVWVVNEVSDSVSIVSVSQKMVVDTLYVKDEPADVVFAGGKAFVTAARKNRVVVFDVTNHVQLASIPLFGENPRALAVNTNETKVYAVFALSGNHTTLIPPASAPPQSKPTNTSLPAPPQVGLIVDAHNPGTNHVAYKMPDNDVVEIDVSKLTISRYFTNVGTVNLGIAIRPGSGDLFIANTDSRNLIHFEPNVRAHIVDNRVTRINITNGVSTYFDLNPGVNYSVLPNLPAKTNALAQPTGIVFDPTGNYFYVAAFGTDRVGKVDPNGNVLARIEIGSTPGSVTDSKSKRGPRGLALNAGAQRLYVLNRISNTLTLVDTSSNTVLKEIPVGSYDPTPTVIRNGRGFLYDAKLSGNGNAACAACHIDAEMDLLAWDLGDPNGSVQSVNTLTTNGIAITLQEHPMKGPMTTQTLRGLAGMEPYHWRGDRTNFLHFDGAFGSLMGGTPLSTADMDAYRSFINTIKFQPNPNQNLDRSYPTSFAGGNAVAGRGLFLTNNYNFGLTCNTCHNAPPGPGSTKLVIPAVALEESQDFKVPQLRNVYQKMSFNSAPGTNSIGGFGLTHDGNDDNLNTFLSRPVFANIRSNATIKANLGAFVQCFDTGTAPAVGYTRTVASTNVSTLSISNDWNLLEAQAAVTNIDLVVKGVIDGRLRGLLYKPITRNYTPDSTRDVVLSRTQLIQKIQAGGRLTVMGVPPGSGVRMAIDRDLDGVLDGDVPAPKLRIGTDTLSWPYKAAGYVLETTSSLGSGAWTNANDAVEIINGQNVMTNPAGNRTRFYRLRLQ
ncbi:beta-propeller fold lactonase family protein [Pedosphaera parvula]|uniref:40-residue YVTN family beta-propeller repeat protein n=1 Tax=Pedosphaera parvula (strain Ellin514) TaxID=320771 RepID=B9XQ19_PEDPL|nr:beta-propeller fold lactonase family protein [Pedosphaera parvula]EEF58023.1 40-residue YVTN family beta-propeller repeat protein [Pedosphaera parvula Ellin514]